MNKKKLLGVALSAALAFSFSASPASATVFETDKCVLTLPETMIYNESEFNYSGVEGIKDSQAAWKTTFITPDMISCTGGVTPDVSDSATFQDAIVASANSLVFRSNANPSSEAQLRWVNESVRDSQNSEWTSKFGFIVSGDGGTYDSIASRFNLHQPHVRVLFDPNVLNNDNDTALDPSDDFNDTQDDYYKNYPLSLAKSFTLRSGVTQSSSPCVVTMPDLTRHYEGLYSANRTYIPITNFKCPTEIKGHKVYFDYVEFVTASGDTNSIGYYQDCNDTNFERKVDSATSFAYSDATQLCIFADGDGVFTQARGTVRDETTGVEYPVVLAAPFKDKYATDVTAKVKKKGSILTIKIHADRNDWFNNENNVGSHKRQTVIAKDKADRAIVKRGNKVIAVVKLSVFGNGKVKIKDIAGKNNYTVTLVETENNHAGVASFKK